MQNLFYFNDVGHIDLNELPVEGLGCGSNAGNNELLEVGDKAAVLAVAEEGDRGTAVNFDRLGVVDREDPVPAAILPVQEIVRLR